MANTENSSSRPRYDEYNKSGASRTVSPRLSNELIKKKPSAKSPEKPISHREGINKGLDAQDVQDAVEDSIALLENQIHEDGVIESDKNIYYLALTGDASRPDFGDKVKIVKCRIVGSGDNRKVVGISQKDQDMLVYAEVTGGTGVSTRIALHNPSLMVIALATPVRTKYTPDGNKSKPYDFVTYVPPNDAFIREDILDDGRKYLRNQVINSRAAMKNVPSKAFPNLSIYEAVDIRLLTLLGIVEHMDVNRFSDLEKANLEVLYNKVLATYSLNSSDAYNYSLSGSGALGAFQMMPKTYDALRKNYPKANLPSNFVGAMQNHTIAAKASLLLIDDQLRQIFRVNQALKKPYLAWKTDNKEGSFMPFINAVLYNSGPKNLKSISNLDDLKKYFPKLPKETQFYLAKVLFVWNKLHDNDFTENNWIAKHLGAPVSPLKKLQHEIKRKSRMSDFRPNPHTLRSSKVRRAWEMNFVRSAIAGVDADGFSTWSELETAFKKGAVTLVPEKGKGYYIDGKMGADYKGLTPDRKKLLSSLRPAAENMLKYIAGEFHKNTRESFKVTSLTRSKEYLDHLRRDPSNQTAKDGKSSHMYGVTFDIAHKHMPKKEIEFLDRFLLSLQKQGYVMVIKESHCFHVVTLKHPPKI